MKKVRMIKMNPTKNSDIPAPEHNEKQDIDNEKSEVKDRVPHGVDYTHTVSGLLDD